MPDDGKLADRAHPSHLWVPSYMRRAKQRISVVFYVNTITRHILVGFPEEFPVPSLLDGYVKVVARTSAEVEKMSELLRKQERREAEMTDEQREEFEGPRRRKARQELQDKMANSSNAINREFCRYALQKLDEDEAKRKLKKVAYMHQEAFEAGR